MMINTVGKLIANSIILQMYDKAAQRLLQRIQQDLADGTAIISPPIEIDKDDVISTAMQALTPDSSDSN